MSSGYWSWLCTTNIDTSTQTIFPVLVTLLAALLLFLSLFKKGINNRLPPGPRGLPIVGYLPFLGPNLHRHFMELSQTYGPIFKLSIGTKLYIIISSPSLAKEVVRDQDITFANRNPTGAALAFSYGGRNIAFAPYGGGWRMLRKLFVREMQSNAILEAFLGHRKNELTKSVKHVYENVGNPINVGELAFSTVINMISSMFWGGTLEKDQAIQVGNELREAVFQLTTILGKPNVSDFFPMLARFDIQGVEREMKKVMLWIGRIFDDVITKHMNSNVNSKRKDFLQFLLQFKEDGRSIANDQIKALLMDIVIGGTDTTSTMVEWTMTELLLHPSIMTRACEEIDKVAGQNNMVEESDIHRLHYLHAVVKEVLRLHPAAPLLLPRSPTHSCTVGGYTIPEGTKVFLNVWAMHRDPQYWNDPLEFRPERFLKECVKLDYLGGHLHYLPFGSGRRICAGLPLGERMLMYVLATFLHGFEWKVAKGAKLDPSEKFGVVLEKSTPLIAIPTPRIEANH